MRVRERSTTTSGSCNHQLSKWDRRTNAWGQTCFLSQDGRTAGRPDSRTGVVSQPWQLAWVAQFKLIRLTKTNNQSWHFDYVFCFERKTRGTLLHGCLLGANKSTFNCSTPARFAYQAQFASSAGFACDNGSIIAQLIESIRHISSTFKRALPLFKGPLASRDFSFSPFGSSCPFRGAIWMRIFR